jgi:hypothetical protein
MKSTFWRGFWEGLNILWWLAWTFWGLAHLLSIPLFKWNRFAWLYPAYNRMMLWSCAICVRHKFSSPWNGVRGETKP